MKLQRDVLITSMLKYQDAFLSLLDYINQRDNDGAYAVPTQLYHLQYTRAIIPKAKANNDQNAIKHLSVDSLLENGVFLKNEKQSGMLVMQSVIVDLLRFIDVKRARELNRKDFELMRANLEESVRQVTNSQVDSDDYRDAMLSYHEVMNGVHSKIKENAERLGVKVDELATEYKALNNDVPDAAINVNTLYDKVNHLYSRYVLPCFEFLNATPLVAKDTFSDAVDAIIDWHDALGGKHAATAQKIGFAKTAISSYYKDVSEFERKLKQYSNSLEADRRSFIALEAAYTQLMESIEERRHGLGRGFKLSSDSLVFSHFSSLDGLLSQRFKQKLKWEGVRSVRRLKEYLHHLESIEVDSADNSLKPVPAHISLESDRQEQIGKRVLKIEMPDKSMDVHHELHSILSKELDDYSLMDLLFALESFVPLNMDKIIWFEADAKRVDDGTYYLTYLPIQWGELSHG
mgnify:CR=1 FL=1